MLKQIGFDDIVDNRSNLNEELDDTNLLDAYSKAVVAASKK